jgi:hypothetical protein
MKKLLILSSILITGLCVSGQNDSVTISFSDIEKVKKAHVKEILYTSGSYFYTIGTNDKSLGQTYRGSEVHIRKYQESDFGFVKEWKYDLPKHNGAEPYFKAAISNEEGIHVLMEAYDKLKQTKYLLHLPIDYDGNAKELRELAAVNCSIQKNRVFDLYFSKDKSHLGVFLNVEEESKNQVPMFYMFDKSMDKKWQRLAQSALDDETTFSISQMEVTNEGDLLVFGYRKKVTFDDGKVSTDEKEALMCYRDRDEVLTADLADIKEYIHTMKMFVDVKGQIVLLGTYSEPNTRRPQGSIFLTYDQKNLERENLSLEKFDQSVMEKLPVIEDEINPLKVHINDGIRVKGYGRDGLRYVRFTDLAIWPDGGFTAIAQRRYTRNYAYGDPAYYFFEDYVIVHMNNEGKITNAKAIPFETGTATGYQRYLGHLFNQTDQRIYLLMNDFDENIKHLRNGEDANVLKRKGYGCTVWEIKRNNSIAFKRVCEHKNSAVPRFRKDKVLHVNQNKAIMIFSDVYGRKMQFAKVTYP